MTRRLSLAGQLLALQVVIICVVLVGVAAVTVAQSTQRRRRSPRAAGRWPSRRRWPTPGRTADGDRRRAAIAYAPGRRREHRAASPARRRSSWRSRRPDRRRQRRPGRAGHARTTSATARCSTGRSLVGRARAATGGRAAVAMAPILTGPERRDRSASSSVTRRYPSVLDGLAAARPEPADLPRPGQRDRHRRLAARRPPGEAADPRAGAGARSPAWSSTARRCCTASARAWSGWTCAAGSRWSTTRRSGCCASPATRSAGRWPSSAWGRSCATRCSPATSSGTGRSPAPGGCSSLNRLPIASRGRPIGSVTTLRDRTELLELRRELDLTRHVTDTLRAQAHEFEQPAAHHRRAHRARGVRRGGALRAPGQLQPVGVQRRR